MQFLSNHILTWGILHRKASWFTLAFLLNGIKIRVCHNPTLSEIWWHITQFHSIVTTSLREFDQLHIVHEDNDKAKTLSGKAAGPDSGFRGAENKSPLLPWLPHCFASRRLTFNSWKQPNLSTVNQSPSLLIKSSYFWDSPPNSPSGY